MAGAAFVAGAVNAVAGGGSLISFPAIVAAGYDARRSSITNSVALWPGYAGGSWGYRHELRLQKRRAVLLSLPSIGGAIAGAVLLVSTPASAFDAVVPFLILFACGVMVFQERLAAFAANHHLTSTSDANIPAPLHMVTFALATYGGYFGGGLGIMMLAALGIFIPVDIQHSNALKGLLSAVINGAAVVYFVLFGNVIWSVAAVMAAGALFGGWVGVYVARRLGRTWLKIAVVVYGVGAAVFLFIR
ncbi:sulfite exporter TauE/SafE family protein [bacterium]|nr:sulfite exporter TauE/SafE family protein [bacterium]